VVDVVILPIGNLSLHTLSWIHIPGITSLRSGNNNINGELEGEPGMTSRMIGSINPSRWIIVYSSKSIRYN
jgi:hypothetical protein